MINKATKGFILFLMGLFLFSCAKEEKRITGTFSYEPASPKAGEKVTIYLLPDSSQLAGFDNINAVIYEYNVNAEKVTVVPMSKMNEYMTATFTPAKETKGLLIKFKSGKREDTNKKHGYVIYMTDGNGNPVPGAKAGLAAAYVRWGRNIDLDNLLDEGLKLFEDEFSKNPAVKDKYLDNYCFALWRKDRKANVPIITKELENLENKTEKTEDDYIVLKNWYGTLGATNKTEKYIAEGQQKFPKGDFTKSVKFDQFRQAKTPEEKEKLLQEFKKEFPNDNLISSFYEDFAYSLIRQGNFDQVYDFFAKNHALIHPFYFDYAAQQMLKSGYDKNKIEEMYNWGVERGRAALNEDPGDDAKTETPDEIKTRGEYYLAKNLLGYGKLLYEKGEKEKALPLLEEGVAKSKDFYADPEMNLLYAKALVESGNDKALSAIEEFVKEGEGSEEMLTLLKKAYVAKNGSDNGYDEYVGKYIDAAKEEMLKTLKDDMINEPAPAFELKDLDGKTVTLADMKGKTLVLDFWATWCGPCLKSFPGMQKAVEFYKDNDKVAFLFVNTWERNVDDKVKNAKDFIAKKKYPFHILIDDQNKVVTDYKVSGIPTKFIIDKDGNIRFKAVGFSGDAHKMVEEIKAMIDLIK
ncbi:MAG: redoxin domain-containing protein [Chlorobi bacterium]|nr:redoxin domain-containing protein [Chlorobiota bacterium]